MEMIDDPRDPSTHTEAPYKPAAYIDPESGDVTVRVDVVSDLQNAVRELVETLDIVLLAQQTTIYHARRPHGDTLNFTMLRGEFNHIKAVADKHRPVDPTQTPAERTKVDNS